MERPMSWIGFTNRRFLGVRWPWGPNAERTSWCKPWGECGNWARAKAWSSSRHRRRHWSLVGGWWLPGGYLVGWELEWDVTDEYWCNYAILWSFLLELFVVGKFSFNLSRFDVTSMIFRAITSPFVVDVHLDDLPQQLHWMAVLRGPPNSGSPQRQHPCNTHLRTLLMNPLLAAYLFLWKQGTP